ncbi:MAG: hypothetical protein CVV02_11135 [Firmicutes bacterium HGW-Firmicutes-7]|nr:MAG: hypothetical protein CVV02_11135 [Firmicutes bacterium HGW-Firmicutes-7]
MSIFRIALNNLKRRKMKSFFIMLGLVVGVSTVIGIITIIRAMNADLGDRIDEFGPNSIILPRSEGVEMGNEMSQEINYDVQKLTMEDIPKILASEVSEYINIISPKLIGAVDVGEQKTLIVGIEPKSEFMQKPWFSLKEQSGIKNGEKIDELAFVELPETSIMIGSSAAKAFDLKSGETIVINEQTFSVFGVLNETGGEEDGLIYANLAVVQSLLNRSSELSMIEVSAYCNACPIEEIAMGLEKALPNSRVIPLKRAALFREETIDRFSTFGLALSGIVLLIAVLVLFKTMLSSINERTREIGIFRAIGFRKMHIVSIIFIEAGLISLIGGIAGFLLGSIMAVYAGPYLAQIQGEITIQVGLLLPSILLSAILAIIASAYPALKAARLNPAEALRFI